MRGVVSPFTLRQLGGSAERLASVISSRVDCENALKTAHSLAHARQPLPAHRRQEILARTAQLVSQRVPELAAQVANECGKPLTVCPC